MPKLRSRTFETAVIERYRRRDIPVEEAIVQMYLAGVSVRRVEDAAEAPWGTRVSSGTASNLNRKMYGHIERWRNQASARMFIWTGWRSSAAGAGRSRTSRSWRRSGLTRRKVRQAAAMPKAIHARESRSAALVKARDVIGKLKAMKLAAAAELVENAIEETLTYYSFPSQHWIKLKTNNPMERLLREARRRTKVVGAFPDGQSALMLVAARLRHVSATQWGLRKYMNVGLLAEMDKEAACAAA